MIREITLYSPAAVALRTVLVGEGSVRRRELMKEDGIKVRFTLDTPVVFPLGTYCVLEGLGRFELTSPYNPTPNKSNLGYDYELPLDAPYMKWKNKIFFLRPDYGAREASWSLTAGLDVHLNVFLGNLAALGYTFNGTPYCYAIDDSVKMKPRVLTYANVSLLDALGNMAKEWETEWWVEDNVIHFGKCEERNTEPLPLEEGVNVEEMSSGSSRDTYATRVYAFGSERNLPASYRKVDGGDVAQGIVQRRLMLPEGTPYIEARQGLQDSEVVEQVVVFDDVYPHREGTVASVASFDIDIKDEDGNITGTAPIFRFTDSGSAFRKDYILEGQTLKVAFQSGSLAGMDFEVAFNPEALPEEKGGVLNTAAQVFEIVRNEDYGRPLPDEFLCPKVKDTYVLYNWDSTKITDIGYVAAAERELKTKAEEYVRKSMEDPNTYTCKIFSDWAYGMDDSGALNSGNAPSFHLGQRVKLVNAAYFAEGFRISRILAIEWKLDIPYDTPLLTIGESAQYSRLSDIETSIEAITFKGGVYQGMGGSNGASVYVLKSGDATQPKETNVLSAVRALATFLNKRTGGIVEGDVTFREGLSLGRSNACRLGSDGTATLGDVTAQALRTPDYNAAEERGAALTQGADGKYHLDISDLNVWGKAIFQALEQRKMTHIGGNLVLSLAANKVQAVYCVWYNPETQTNSIEPVGVSKEMPWTLRTYRCYILTDDGSDKTEILFQRDDLARCQRLNTAPSGGTPQDTQYWRSVVNVEQNSIQRNGRTYGFVDLSADDCAQGSAIPKAGDDIVLFGSKTDTSRQNIITLETTGTAAPSIREYRGVDTFSLEGCCKTRVSPTEGNFFTGDFIVESSGVDVGGELSSLNGRYSSFIVTINGLQSQVGDLSTTAAGLQQSVSTIEQTTQAIRLSVMNAASRGRNLLMGSYFNAVTNMYGGYQRETFLIEGKTYTLTLWGRCTDALVAEDGFLRAWIFTEDWAKSAFVDIRTAEMQMQSVTFVCQRTDKYIMDFYPTLASGGGATNRAVVEKVQLEEGAVATPWSLSDSDSEVNANMLPLIDRLQCATGAEVIAAGYTTEAGESVDAVHYDNEDTADYTDVLYLNALALKRRSTYTLSFWAKGEGSVSSSLYTNACVGSLSNNTATSNADGCTAFVLQPYWQRFSVTFTTSDDVLNEAKNLIVARTQSGTEVWLAAPKLEEGGRVTEYRLKGIDEAALLATGIDIRNRRIEATADNFRIRNNKGDTTFDVDENGNISFSNANFAGLLLKKRVVIETAADVERCFRFAGNVPLLGNIGCLGVNVSNMYTLYDVRHTLNSEGEPLKFILPSFYWDVSTGAFVFENEPDIEDDADCLAYIRSMVDNSVLIYNKCPNGETFDIYGWIKKTTTTTARAKAQGGTSDDTDTTASTPTITIGGYQIPMDSTTLYHPDMYYVVEPQTITLEPGQLVVLKCVCNTVNGRERVIWEADFGVMFTDYEGNYI